MYNETLFREHLVSYFGKGQNPLRTSLLRLLYSILLVVLILLFFILFMNSD